MKKYTVITGASSGIGEAAAYAFAKRGKNLILVARRKQQLATIQSDIVKKYPTINIVIDSRDLTVTEDCLSFYNSLSDYTIETWINNAGVGLYDLVGNTAIARVQQLLRLNIEALTLLSSLFVRDYKNIEGTQLINISSAGGYTIVPTATIYCASKFYVSSFTEGLAQELMATNCNMRAKVLAPAATETEFGMHANDVERYEYDSAFSTYHSSEKVAELLLELYDSSAIVGYVDRMNFSMELSKNRFNDSYKSLNNQKKE